MIEILRFLRVVRFVKAGCGPGRFFFFLNDPAPPETYPLPLPDALPISRRGTSRYQQRLAWTGWTPWLRAWPTRLAAPGSFTGTSAKCIRSWGSAHGSPAPVDTWCSWRSEEHTSELQSQSNLVCRLLLEK